MKAICEERLTELLRSASDLAHEQYAVGYEGITERGRTLMGEAAWELISYLSTAKSMRQSEVSK